MTNSTQPLLAQYDSSDSEEEGDTDDKKAINNSSTQPSKLTSSGLPAGRRKMTVVSEVAGKLTITEKILSHCCGIYRMAATFV